MLGHSLLKCPFPPHVWQFISLFLVVDIVEPLALAAGCGDLFVLETLDSGLVEGVPRIEEFWPDCGGVVGAVLDEKRLLAALRAANYASSANCASASRA